jgi:hypothetical protein
LQFQDIASHSENESRPSSEKLTPRDFDQKKNCVFLLILKHVYASLSSAYRKNAMVRITPFLFNWQDINSKSDLDRLKLVLDTIPDESLMKRMESFRGKSRNDYPDNTQIQL